MAIAYDNSGGGAQGGNNQAVTIGFTIGGGSNRMLIAFVGNYGGATLTGATLVKYNAVAMTLIGTSLAFNRFGNYYQIDAYYMLDTNLGAGGSHNFTCTTHAAANNTWINLVSFSGVKQQAPTYVNAVNATSNILTLSTTGLSFNASDWLVDGLLAWPSGVPDTFTPGTGQVFRVAQGSDRYLETSTLPNGAAGTSWTWTANASQATGLVTLDLVASGAAAVANNSVYFGMNF